MTIIKHPDIMNYSRRQFQLMTITAAVSTAMTAVSYGATQEKQVRKLRRSSVLRGLKRGFNTKGPVQELLSKIQLYSIEQTLLGGCVLCLAAGQPADTVHILVKADPIKVAEALSVIDIEGMQSINGNSIICDYEGQHFFIEHLSEELYEERLENLAPGSKDNGFHIEFAHQLFTYNVQSKRSRDPKAAIGKSSTIKLKRVSRSEDSASVLKTMVEAKRLGLELPKDELRVIENTIQQGLSSKEDSLAATATFLSQLSHFTQYHEERDTRQLMNSNLANDTLGKVLGCNTGQLHRTYIKIRKKAPKGTPDSELWLCAIQCLEDTDQINCHETLYFLKKHHSGHHLLCSHEDCTNSSHLLRIKSIERLHIKQKKRRSR